MNVFDVILAGVGSTGSAAAYHLASRGARVLALDRSSVPNNESSHSGATRIIRKAYFEHPDYVPLLVRAYELWRELEAEAGTRVLFTPGVLYVGPRAGSWCAARSNQPRSIRCGLRRSQNLMLAIAFRAS